MITIQDTIYMGTAAPASGGGGSITVDQTYDATSPNAQSGTAVAEAIATKQDVLTAGSNISINNNIISATDTTYSAFRGATSSVAGSAGLVPAPTTRDVDKYLKGDGTWAMVSSGSGIQNTATGTDSLTILGTAATSKKALNIGVGTTATAQGIAIGSGTENHEGTNYGTSAGYNSIAIGYIAKADTGISIGAYTASINDGIAIGSGFVDPETGDEDYNNADNGIAIGNCAKARGSIVIGADSISSEYDNIIIGDEVTASSNRNIIIGDEVRASSNAHNNIVIGREATVSSANGNIIIGQKANAYNRDGMILIGSGAAPIPLLNNSPQFVIGSGEIDPQTDKFINYLMLDLRTGKIPNDRINGVSGSFTSQDGKTVTVTNGVITNIA